MFLLADSKVLLHQVPCDVLCCRTVQYMLGGAFDYRQAATQLSQAAAAVQHLVSTAKQATDCFNSGSCSMLLTTADAPAAGAVAGTPLGGAATATATAAHTRTLASWSAVLGDAMPPLTKFYEQEDAWQDVERFGQVQSEACAAAGHFVWVCINCSTRKSQAQPARLGKSCQQECKCVSFP